MKLAKAIHSIRRNKLLYMLLLPVVAYYAIFHYAPIGGLVIAFMDYMPSRGILASECIFLTGDDINGNFNLVLSAFGANASQWIYKDGEIVHGVTQPELIEAVEFIRKLYADGLINKNYLTDDSDARTAAIANDKAGGMYAAFNYADTYRNGVRV